MGHESKPEKKINPLLRFAFMSHLGKCFFPRPHRTEAATSLDQSTWFVGHLFTCPPNPWLSTSFSHTAHTLYWGPMLFLERTVLNENVRTGAVKMMRQLLWWAQTFLLRTRVQFPACTWWLTTCDKSSSGESDTLFWPPYVLHACSTQT